QIGAGDLDPGTKRQLEQGQRVTEILKQSQYSPNSLPEQVCIIYAAVNGFMSDVPVEKCASFEKAFNNFMKTNHPEIGKSIQDTKDIIPANEDALKKAIAE